MAKMARSKKGKVVEDLVEVYKELQMDDDHAKANYKAKQILLRFIDDPEVTEWFNNIWNSGK